MNKAIGIVVLAILGLGFLYLFIKGVGIILDHPLISLLIAIAVSALGSRFLAVKKS
jgi:hypothetical protein